MERCIIFCLLWILSICSHHVDGSPTFTEEREERILGGTNSPWMPWIASVRLSNAQVNYHICGGFIVNQRWIATAAQCMTHKTIHNIVVGVGTTTSQGGTIYRILEIEVHQDYDEDTLVNDVALLRTDRQIEFSTAITSIHLATNNTFIGTPVLTYGWGSISAGGNMNVNLIQASFNSVTNALCLTRFPPVVRSLITDRHICTQAATVATCPGDAGGPIVFNGVAVGILSWVEPCVAGTTNVNTRISSYVDWISNITRADN